MDGLGVRSGSGEGQGYSGFVSAEVRSFSPLAADPRPDPDPLDASPRPPHAARASGGTRRKPALNGGPGGCSKTPSGHYTPSNEVGG